MCVGLSGADLSADIFPPSNWTFFFIISLLNFILSSKTVFFYTQ